ncbi:MAG: hypothetical protein IJJ50_08720 [Lachnospiraceae bacterium]|nr:hypothetical protein [Lachnospiraceae bacterium]
MDPGKRGIPASVLKQIAVLTMLIDHVTAGLMDLGYWAAGNPVTPKGRILYRVLRGVGRIAFPIYCFLIVEGFFHTKNKWKYLLRLTLFGLLSEIPFDICLEKAYIYMGYQNVFFTLALGLLGIILYDTAVRGDYLYARPLRKLAGLLGMAAAAAAAWLMKTDYSWYGVLVIYFFFLFRESFTLKLVFTEVMLCLLNPLELVSLADFPLFLLYNGQRGPQKKYFYYIFYPAHLLLIAAARYVLYGIFVR